MGLAEQAELVVKLTLAGNYAAQVGSAKRVFGSLDAQLSKTEGRAFKAGQQIGTGIKNGLKIGAVGVAALASQVALGLDSLVKLEGQVTQTNAVIKSTGGVAGISADAVRKLAEKYEGLNATIGDETIQNAENLLLTFTNVRKEAFEPALEAALNMNKALGKGEDGLADTLRIVGKALNDPAKGLVQLQRLGIRLTDDQKKQIASALAVNDVYGAQRVIIDELDKRFGGSFLAGGTTTAGKVAKFKDSIEDLQRALATALLPTIGKIADKLTAFLADPNVVKGVEELGKKIAALFSDENLKTGGDILKTVFDTARDAAPTIAAAAKITGEVVKTAVSLFRSLPPEIQKLAIGAFAINKLTGGLVTNIAGGLISSVLKQLVSGVVNVSGGVVNVTGGVGGPGGIPPVAPTGGLPSGIVTPMIGAGIILDKEQIKQGMTEAMTKVANAHPEWKGADWQELRNGGPLPVIDPRTLAGIGGLSQDARDERHQGQINAEGIKQAQRATAAATDRTKAAIDRAKSIIASATRDSGSAVSSAVERKRLVVNTTFAPTINTNVTVRELNKAHNTYKSVYKANAVS